MEDAFLKHTKRRIKMLKRLPKGDSERDHAIQQLEHLVSTFEDKNKA